MIIDSHQHYWVLGQYNYYWLTPALGVIYNNFVPEDLEPQLKKTGVEKTVLVQTCSELEETFYFNELAKKYDFIGATVGWVDLQDPHTPEILDKLADLKYLRSIRHQVEDEADPDWLLQPVVIDNIKSIKEHGFKFDALVRQDQLHTLDTIVEKVPDLEIVLDHCAKPKIVKGIKEAMDEWEPRITRAAKLPIKCKMSGLLTEADHTTWTVEDIRPFTDKVLELFGPDRVMWGSDWPVSTMSAEYETSVKTYTELVSGCSAEDQHKILYQNAKDFYGIE